MEKLHTINYKIRQNQVIAQCESKLKLSKLEWRPWRQKRKYLFWVWLDADGTKWIFAKIGQHFEICPCFLLNKKCDKETNWKFKVWTFLVPLLIPLSLLCFLICFLLAQNLSHFSAFFEVHIFLSVLIRIEITFYFYFLFLFLLLKQSAQLPISLLRLCVHSEHFVKLSPSCKYLFYVCW